MNRNNNMPARVDNEARGERAYDRIKAEARSRPTSHSPIKFRCKSGPRDGSMVGNSRRNPRRSTRLATNVQRGKNTKNTNLGRTEDDAMEEAISRSLADKAHASSSRARLTKPKTTQKHETDLAKAKMQSLSDDSYEQDEFDFSPNLPYAPLGPLYNDIHAAGMLLQAHAERGRKVSPTKVLRLVRYWEETVFEVVHDLERAEEKRIEDIRAQIDLDMEVEKKHQRRLQGVNEIWEAKMAAREEEWVARMEAQKQMYEAKLAGQNHPQKAVSSETKERDQFMSTTTLYPMPEPVMTQGGDIQASQRTATTKLESKHAKETAFLEGKLNRALGSNEKMRTYIQERNASKDHGTENTGQVEDRPPPSADVEAESERKDRGHKYADGFDPTERLNPLGLLSKRKRDGGDEGDQGGLKGASLSPKRSRNGTVNGGETC